MSAFYHGLTRTIVGAFGALFSDIHVIRRYDNSVSGDVAQDIKVPISYAPKMKWWQAFVENPARQKEVNITLPRMSFEILGFTFDASRKVTRSMDIRCKSEGGKTISTPSPWNIEIGLYIVANNQEDIFQILEQILPFFNPDRTITIKAVKDMKINNNIPIALQSVSIQDDYDGEFTTHRLIVYTLSFLVKMNYWGEVKDTTLIKDVETSIGDSTHQLVYDEENKTITENWMVNTDAINVDTSSCVDAFESVKVEFTEREDGKR